MGVNVSKQNQFLAQIVPLVQKQAAKHDYHLFPSVTIAQAIHETGWGTSKRMVAANALFGVKVGKAAYKFGKAWKGAAYKTGTTEYYDGKTATKITDWFRQYDTVEDSICDYMDMLLHCSRYRRAVDCKTPRQSIEGIIAGGYATGPNYVKAIMNLIKTYNLTQFDKKGIESVVCPFAIPEDNAKALKRGTSGEYVKALQWCLNMLVGHKLPAKLAVDGRFGPSTENAVYVFQIDYGLTQDGIAGKQTWGEIKKQL